MKKILFILTALFLCVALCVSCQKKPVKNTNVYTGIAPQTDESVIPEIEKVEYEEPVETEEIPEEVIEELPEKEVPEVIDTHVYTADELTDELIKEKLIGYWEFDTFGYLGGYNFFESGFLQLVLKREVNQTGIFMVRNKGVYFSLDSKSWDEDVLVIHSVSYSEVVGSFGDDMLVLHRADASLIKENSSLTLDDSNNYGGIIDAASEVSQNVKVN